MIAPIALLTIGSAIGGFSGGSKEAKQEEVSKGTESLEAINENQELASSVEDLTEEYQALRASGESTAEVLENM
jgi:outer membrane murein-binding lipoprotein Lpp